MTWLLVAWLLLGLTNLAGLARAYHRPQPPRHRLRRPGEQAANSGRSTEVDRD